MQKHTDDELENETIFSMEEQIQECIDNCTDCSLVCEQMVHHCLTKGGVHAAPERIRLLLDCVESCKTAVGFMVRHSPFHMLTCATCAEVCTACADDCEAMKDDELMVECIEICRRCADTCRAMAHMQH